MAKLMMKSGVSYKDLEEGVVFQTEPQQDDSSDESFDDETFDTFKEDMMNVNLGVKNRPRYLGGEGLPFHELKKKMKPLTGDGLVKKDFLKYGTGTLIPEKSIVMMHYEAYVEERKEPFDSSRLRQRPFKFLFGDGNVLPGLELGIKTMKKGEIARFIVGPEYAFGAMGCPPRIPAGAEILYEVEILNFFLGKEAIEFEEMAPEDQKKAPFEQIAGVYRCENQMANDLFRQKIYKPAIARYKKVVRLLEDVSVEDEEADDKRKEYLLKTYLNLSQCFLCIQNPHKAIIYADLALKLDPESPKGLYRMGYGLHMTDDYERAEYYLNRARKHKPFEKSINAAILKLEQKRKLHHDWERRFCRKMWGSEQDMPKKAPPRSKEMQELYDIINQEIIAFIESDERELPFSSGYTESQLQIVKEVAQAHDLAFVTKIMCGRKINKVAKKWKS